MILSFGEILFDLFPDGKRLGGAPFNFAFHLKKLGFPVCFISRVGQDDHGKAILKFLETHEFDPKRIQIDPAHDTGRVRVTLNPDKSHGFTIVKNAAWDHLVFDDFLAGLVENAPALIYFGSLIQRGEKGRRFIKEVMARKKDSTRVFCDINLRPNAFSQKTILDCLDASNILKLSHEELDEIQGITIGKSASMEASIRQLMAAHAIDTVILTLGSCGSQWFTNETHHAIQASKAIPLKDTVGAGDAYAAMSAAGILKGLPMNRTGTLAAEFAARICGIAGALPETCDIYSEFKPMIGTK